MALMNLDTYDVYEFEYNGNKITVGNSELKAKIVLMINGEVAAESTGIKAVTGIGELEGKLENGAVVKASIKKIKLGDSECKVTVDGKELTLVSENHGKKNIADEAAKKAGAVAGQAKDAVKGVAEKVTGKK